MPADLAALYAVERVCFAPPMRFSRALMRELSENPNCRTWVGIANGVCAGFAMVNVRGDEDPYGEPRSDRAYIWTIEVLPVFRRMGVARELMQRVEESARAAGCQAIELHVAAGNEEAIALYERFGFERTGVEPGFYGKGLDGFRYSKTLSRMD